MRWILFKSWVSAVLSIPRNISDITYYLRIIAKRNADTAEEHNGTRNYFKYPDWWEKQL